MPLDIPAPCGTIVLVLFVALPIHRLQGNYIIKFQRVNPPCGGLFPFRLGVIGHLPLRDAHQLPRVLLHHAASVDHLLGREATTLDSLFSEAAAEGSVNARETHAVENIGRLASLLASRLHTVDGDEAANDP